MNVNDQLDFWALVCRIHEAGYVVQLNCPDWKSGLLDANGVTIVARYDDREATFTGTSYLSCLGDAVEFAEQQPSTEFV